MTPPENVFLLIIGFSKRNLISTFIEYHYFGGIVKLIGPNGTFLTHRLSSRSARLDFVPRRSTSFSHAPPTLRASYSREAPMHEPSVHDSGNDRHVRNVGHANRKQV